VLIQLIVPKTTRENGEKLSSLNTPTASANPGAGLRGLLLRGVEGKGRQRRGGEEGKEVEE